MLRIKEMDMANEAKVNSSARRESIAVGIPEDTSDEESTDVDEQASDDSVTHSSDDESTGAPVKTESLSTNSEAISRAVQGSI